MAKKKGSKKAKTPVEEVAVTDTKAEIPLEVLTPVNPQGNTESLSLEPPTGELTPVDRLETTESPSVELPVGDSTPANRLETSKSLSLEPPVEESTPVDPQGNRESPSVEPPVEEEAPGNPDERSVALDSFMKACQSGNLPKVKELCAVISATDTFADKVTGLHWAAINNRISVVRYLVQQNPKAIDLRGGDLDATALQWACRYGLVYIADHLIRCGADPSLVDSQGFNCLHLAVHSSNVMLVIYLLSATSLYIDAPDPHSRTALGWAAYQGDALTVEVCLRYGADTTLADDQGFCALHWTYMRGTFLIIKQLLESGADARTLTGNGKSSFDIANDMNCTPSLERALYETGRDPKTGAIKPALLNKATAKVMTFLVPFAMLGLLLLVLRFTSLVGFFRVGALFPAVALLHYLNLRLVVPNYLRSRQDPLLKTPFLAGVFAATTLAVVAYWLVCLRVEFAELPVTSVGFVLASTAVIWLFFKTMVINPGYIPRPANRVDTQAHIDSLIEQGRFDAQHFCIHTLVAKPMRAKYSEHSQQLVAGFDHYCPWVYNEIGVRNHKLFVGFILTLAVAIVCFLHMLLEYFDNLPETEGECWLVGDALCQAAEYAPVGFNLFFWACFQFVWLSFLIFTQLFQISRGLTTYEASKLMKRDTRTNPYYSSVPDDLEGAEPQPESQTPLALPPVSVCGTVLRLLGLDQFLSTARDAAFSQRREVPTDYGVKTNCLDFWFLGDPHYWRNVFLLPIEGERNLNGKPVDYYTLYTLPPRV